MTKFGEKYFNDTMKDPSLENVFKGLLNFQQDDEAKEDPDLKEI